MTTVLRTSTTLRQFTGSARLAVILLSMGVASICVGEVIEATRGPLAASILVYDAWWLDAQLILLASNLAMAVLNRIPLRRDQLPFSLAHGALLLLLFGTWLSRSHGIEGRVQLERGEATSTLALSEQEVFLLPLGPGGQPLGGGRQRHLRSSGIAAGTQSLVETPDQPGVELLAYRESGQASQEQAGPDAEGRPEPEAETGPNLRVRLHFGGARRTLTLALGRPQELTLEGGLFLVGLRQAKRALPFSVLLEDRKEATRLRPEAPETFEVELRFDSPTGQFPASRATLTADRPAHFMGYRLSLPLQESASGHPGEAIRLDICHDPGLAFIYVSMVLLVLATGWYLAGDRQQNGQSEVPERGPAEPEVDLSPHPPPLRTQDDLSRKRRRRARI